MEGGEMSLERKGDGEEFCKIRYGGMWQLKFTNLNRIFVITFHVLNLDTRSMPSHQDEKYSKFLPIIWFHGNNSN